MLKIRDATRDDAPAILEIYRHYVIDTSSTFEVEPPSLEEIVKRVQRNQEKWAWLVAVDEDGVLGYAYGGMHRAREAYNSSVETSIYLSKDATGRGVGRRLYDSLHDRLTELGYCNAYAGITLPNPASIRLHLAVGYRFVGVFPRIGFKFGQWHDVAWWTRRLRDEHPSQRQ